MRTSRTAPPTVVRHGISESCQAWLCTRGGTQRQQKSNTRHPDAVYSATAPASGGFIHENYLAR